MLPSRSHADNIHKTKQLSMYIVLVKTLSADVHATNDNFDKPQLRQRCILYCTSVYFDWKASHQKRDPWTCLAKLANSWCCVLPEVS